MKPKYLRPFILLVVAVHTSVIAQSPKVQWKRETQFPSFGSVDIDDDGFLDLAIGNNNVVQFLDGRSGCMKAQIQFRRPGSDWIDLWTRHWPDVLEMVGEFDGQSKGMLQAYSSEKNDRFILQNYLLNTGRRQWQTAPLAVSDGDFQARAATRGTSCHYDIIVSGYTFSADRWRTVIYVIDGSNGFVRWRKFVDVGTQLKIVDAGADGRNEILISAFGSVDLLDASTGKLKWHIAPQAPAKGAFFWPGDVVGLQPGPDTHSKSAEIFPRLAGDNNEHLLIKWTVDTNSILQAYGIADKKLLWEQSFNARVQVSAVSNVDHDDNNEVLVRAEQIISVLDGKTGDVQWTKSYDLFSSRVGEVAAVDIDNDGCNDVVFHKRYDPAMILGCDGQTGFQKWQFNVSGIHPFFAQSITRGSQRSVFKDFDHDGSPDLLAHAYAVGSEWQLYDLRTQTIKWSLPDAAGAETWMGTVGNMDRDASLEIPFEEVSFFSGEVWSPHRTAVGVIDCRPAK